MWPKLAINNGIMHNFSFFDRSVSNASNQIASYEWSLEMLNTI